jgi:GNAT superfamily N-acetyltransferase
MAGDDLRHIVIRDGYVPSLIGRVVAMHALYYSRLVGFGAAFESKVATEFAEFVTRLDRPVNAVWHLHLRREIVGSIAIDGEDPGGGRAHLRWFIIDDVARGAGFGDVLLQKALDFCDDQNVPAIQLSTFMGLDVARNLFERNGFVMTDEFRGDRWGTKVFEQTFLRQCP